VNTINEMNKILTETKETITIQLEQIKERIQCVYMNKEKQTNEFKLEVNKNRFEKIIVETIDKLIHKVQGIEEEAKEMKAKITEMQTKVSEAAQNIKENNRKSNRTSDSSEELSRKRKPSDNSSSDEENNKINGEKHVHNKSY
jgi:hypothetical protein